MQPMAERPKISIVTVNFNMHSGLDQTIRSVLGQSYKNLEYVIVDGASTDGSQDLLKTYHDRVDKIISEKDRNLYDGMNKGVSATTGEWILFMNSGDCFADADVVSDVFSETLDKAEDYHDADIVYGNVIWHYEREGLQRLMIAELPSVLSSRMNCSHQAMFTRSELLRKNPFDLDLLIADYDFLMRCRVNDGRFVYVNRVIAITTRGGRSDRYRLTCMRQHQQVLRRYGQMTLRLRLAYPFVAAYAWASLLLREALPPRVTRWILQRK